MSCPATGSACMRTCNTVHECELMDRRVTVAVKDERKENLGPAMRGVKYDQSKLPLDLLDPVALEGLAAVLAFGANKYAAHNWRGGFKWARLIAALLRHVFAIMRGELIDPESNLPHIDHVGCCWMFLSNMMKTRPDLNDLYKANETPPSK